MKFREDKTVREWLERSLAQRAIARVDTRFHGADTGRIDTTRPLEAGNILVRCGRNAVLLLEPSEDKSQLVLTSNAERENDCLILFQHSYGRVRCEIGSRRIPTLAHIGFLGRPAPRSPLDPPELHSITLESKNGGLARTSMDFSPEAPQEIIGIVWRGGAVQFESIVLEP